MPQIVHLGARTGFVQELQMSQRQTWLIRRDMVLGAAQPSSQAVGVKPGLSLGRAFVEGRPAYAAPLACIVAARAAWDSAHRFAAVLPLGAPSTRSNIVGGRGGRGACGRPSI